MVRKLIEDDIQGVLKLAAEVEHLFGPMVNNQAFVEGLRSVIKADNAFGYESTDHELDGAIAIDPNENAIAWLSVSSKAKRKGVGSRLLERALDELDSQKPVMVQTFASSVEEGLPAKRLYEKYGFYDVQDAGKNPAGVETVLMKRDG